MTDEDRSDELYTRFLETEEMQDWEDFVGAAKKALKADPHAQTVTVPAGFLRRVMTDIATTPHMFYAYRERFNQLCDEMGVPEEKRGIEERMLTGEITSEDMVSRRKFSVRSKPIHYKTSPKDEEPGDDDGGGPF